MLRLPAGWLRSLVLSAALARGFDTQAAPLICSHFGEIVGSRLSKKELERLTKRITEFQDACQHGGQALRKDCKELLRHIVDDHSRMEAEYARLQSEQLALEQWSAEAKTSLGKSMRAEYDEIIQQSEAEIQATRERLERDFGPFLQKARRLMDPYEGRPVLIKFVSMGSESAGAANLAVARKIEELCRKMKWEVKTEANIITSHGDESATEITMHVTGADAWRYLQHESGIHTVQTNFGQRDARKFTSKLKVFVRPEILPSESKVLEKDITISVSRASGAGGQGVNTTDSAVEIIHVPTKLKVRAQSQRSQHQNKELAMQILRARVAEFYERADKAQAGSLLSGLSDGNVRTYDLVAGRIRDSRFESNIPIDDFPLAETYTNSALWFDEVALRRLLARP